MRRLPIACVLVGVCLAVPAAAQTEVRQLEVERRLTERQLTSLRARYQAARAREVAARARVDELAGDLDRRLGSDGATADELDELERSLIEARGRADAAGETATALRREFLELVRRVEIVDAELSRLRGAPADLPDPVTGAWNLAIQPGDRRGLLDLTLDGTQVSGTLGLDDGSFGSVRGTFTDGSLRLERVSAEGGLDMVLEGRLDPAAGTFGGSWRPVVLGRGESPGGTWEATPAEVEETETPGQAGGGGER
jgi:hypothetical protein